MTARDDLMERVARELHAIDIRQGNATAAWEDMPFPHQCSYRDDADRILALLSEREPVAWAWYTDEDERLRFNAEGKKPKPYEHPTNKYLVPLYAGPAPERGEAREDGRLYPCDHSGCDVMRTKAEGGTTFTVCEEHWKERGAAQVAPAITEEGEDE